MKKKYVFFWNLSGDKNFDDNNIVLTLIIVKDESRR